jgi:hypothetical protein
MLRAFHVIIDYFIFGWMHIIELNIKKPFILLVVVPNEIIINRGDEGFGNAVFHFFVIEFIAV